jgi:hypothetical protein
LAVLSSILYKKLFSNKLESVVQDLEGILPFAYSIAIDPKGQEGANTFMPKGLRAGAFKP